MKLFKKNRLYCFSPTIMIVTFIIEITLAIYSFIKAKKMKSDYVIPFVLFFLAAFQFAEYQVCGGFNNLFWSRFGLFSITTLPVLGLYLVSKLGKETILLKISIIIGIAFAAFFIGAPSDTNQAVCTGNYVIFDIYSDIHAFYAYFYFGFLLYAIYESVKLIRASKGKEKLVKALKWFIYGYLSFIVPLTIVFMTVPSSRSGVASIMCGFAVIFSIVLTFKVGPTYYEIVKSKKSS